MKWLKRARSAINNLFTVAALIILCLIVAAFILAIVAVALLPFAALGVWTLVGLQHIGWF